MSVQPANAMKGVHLDTYTDQGIQQRVQVSRNLPVL